MKAVLVVDVEEYGDYYADVYRKNADDRFEGRYYLKPLPNRWIPQLNGLSTEQQIRNIDFAGGWNACIKKITGEAE